MTSFQVVSIVRDKYFIRCQSSMARKPKRLALMLTILWITVQNCFVFGLKQINQNIEDDDISGLLNNSKFGDRISPRRVSSVTSVFSSRSSNIGFLDDRLRSLNSKIIKINNNNQLSALNINSIKNKEDEEDNLTVTENFIKKTVGLTRKSDDNLRFQTDDDGEEEIENERPPSNFEAHRLEMSTEFFVVPSSAASSIVRSTTIRPGGVIIATKNLINKNNVLFRNNTAVHPAIISAKTGGLRKEPWVVPVLVLAAISMLMMVAFEIFVICKAWSSTPSRRHLFLGQMLLLGLFACAGLAAVLTVSPTTLTCATVRFGAGVSLALVFASLLVKCVFLISLNSGVYLPAPYQGLLLLFAVLIQVAVGAQWLLTSPPGVDNYPINLRNSSGAISSRYSLYLTPNEQTVLTPTVPLCKTPFPELLLSLIYVVFLIIFVAVLAIKSRRIRDNYREATYIGLAIGGTIPIWLGWTLCGLVVADRHRDSCLAFGLVATSAMVFLVMFMPKSRQLAALGKEGFYVEDREEQFSSLSRAGSGYSPSFFHFKPIKYGVMGQKMISTINTVENGGNTKNQAVAQLGGGLLIFCFIDGSINLMHEQLVYI